MTEAERKLWSKLNRKQLYDLQFLRQKPLGKYIVDFYCPTQNLVIEVDGGQHYCDDYQIKKDQERDAYFEQRKIKVLRFSNYDVLKDADAVVEEICREIIE